MNNAKKLAKNNGVSKKQGGGSGSLSFVSSKNKVLAILGILAVIVLCAGVCYMQLRPRAVLIVSTTDENGSQKKDTVYMKEAVYSIYQIENQYSQYSSIYQQLYGKTYWEMEDVDGKGRSGASAAKKQVMDSLKQREILYMEAQKRGYSLTDEEINTTEESFDTTMKNFTDKQKKMEGLDEKTLKSTNATMVKSVFRVVGWIMDNGEKKNNVCEYMEKLAGINKLLTIRYQEKSVEIRRWLLKNRLYYLVAVITNLKK